MAAVFFDIDGTLWDRTNVIPESAQEAIRLLKKNGHLTFICSGRTRVYIMDETLLSLGFDGLLCGCGTHVEYRGEDLLYYKIGEDLLDRTVRMFYDHEMPMVMEGRYLIYMDPEIIGRDEYGRYLLETLKGRTMPIRGNRNHWEVSKFSVIIEGTDYRKVIRELQDDYEFLVHAGESVMEVVPKGYSKATAMQLICSRLGIPRADTYAFGDSANDIEMLDFAGTGIAMGNGSETVRKMADYVTDGLHEDGIYRALRHFSLI